MMLSNHYDEFLIVAFDKNDNSTIWTRDKLSSAKGLVDNIITYDINFYIKAEVYNIYGGVISNCLYRKERHEF